MDVQADLETAAGRCAEVQRSIARSTALMAGLRAAPDHRGQGRITRRLAREARAHLEASEVLFDALRVDVEAEADSMRARGVGERDTLNVMRLRVRVALYDRQFTQDETEPVVGHLERWVHARYQAA